jgi:D-ribose pyranose/furanose isomerase RbsD
MPTLTKEDPVDELLLLHSGDALVMASMAVLHGVQEIVISNPDMAPTVGLPVPGLRLGLLLWQGSSSVDESVRNMSEEVKLEEVVLGVNIL